MITETSSMNMKNCPFCGAALPEAAHFCPVCAKSLIEKEAITPKTVRKKPKPWLIVAALLVVALIVGAILYHSPKTYDDKQTASLVYETGGRTYHLILRNTVRDEFHWKDPQAVYERKVPADLQLAIPLQLYVFDEETGENVSAEFYKLLKDSFVTVEVVQGDSPDPAQPTVNENFPRAMLETDIVCTSRCNLSSLTWTLQMKNKDTLLLHETVQITELPQLLYSYEDTPLNTTADIQAILDSFPEGDETEITIVLAPIEYEGGLTFGNLNVTLQGTKTESATTKFTGPVTVTDSNLVNIIFSDIDFVGNGEGSGIIAYGTFFANSCTFKNLDMGIEGREGSWPIPYESTFENCRIAFFVDSTSCHARSAYFGELVFLNNKIAVQLIHMPSDDVLTFMDCTFEGNGTDFDVQSGNKIELQ